MYKPTEITIKRQGETKDGKPYTIYAVKFEGNNDTYDTFDKMEVGQTYEGEIVANANPKYGSSFKVKKAPRTGNFASKTASMEKAMEVKQQNIKQSQDAKYEGITRAGAIRCATDLLIAMLNNNKLELAQPLLTSADVHRMLEAEIKYYESLYTSPFL